MPTSALPPVGRTAVAAARVRAHESARPDRLFDDWLAGLLAPAQPSETPANAGDPAEDPGVARRRRALAFHVIIRTRFYDEYLLDATGDGIRQVVLLGAGLDGRAYRLPWPTGVQLFEVDLGAVLDYKHEVLSAQPGLAPGCTRHEVRADLVADWSQALRREGFDPAAPTAWLAEGLLVYLEPADAERLLSELTTLSAPGSRLALESGATTGAAASGAASPVEQLWKGGLGLLEDWLPSAGWHAVSHPLHEIAEGFGRSTGGPLRSALITAIREEDPVVARLRAAGCVFAEDEARLLAAAATDAQELDALVEGRASGVPLELVLGWAEFCGLRIAVAAGVFVPRRRTEFLAQQAISRVRPGDVVVELCCGSGAISAALLAAFDHLQLHAADIDPVAVRCARGNLPAANVYTGDLYQPLPDRLRGRVNLVVANAPYVPTAELGLLPREARDYEPPATLEGGADGLEIARRVAAAAPLWLAPGGHVLVETSERQAASLVESMTGYGLVARTVSEPEVGATVVIGTRPEGAR